MTERPPSDSVLPPRLVYRRFSVEVLAGEDVGKRVVSEAPELQIGTAPGNEMVLADTTVSRHHCSIVATDDGFLVTDLDSMNGVRLGGYRVRAAFLKDMATLKLGRVKLGFAMAPGELGENLSTTGELGDLVGDSRPMRRLFARAETIAPSPRRVLLEGEPGTGKRALAEAIHALSTRADNPFHIVDLVPMSPNEMNAGLFGDDGGLAKAVNGTLYIAGVGELPIELQDKLLARLPTTTARLITATHRDLRPSVNRGRFRADLYHQAADVRLRIPPLRERTSDIAPLALHLFRGLFPEAQPPSNDIIDSFSKREWWGNATALRQAIQREAAPTT